MSWRWDLNSVSKDFFRRIEINCTNQGNLPYRGKPPIVKTYYIIKHTNGEDWLITPFAWSRSVYSSLSTKDKNALIRSSYPENISSFITCKIQLRDYQNKAMLKVRKYLDKHRCCILSAFCSWGKTKSSLWLSVKLECSTAIIIPPSNIICQQWINNINECFELTKEAKKKKWKLVEKVSSNKFNPKCIFYIINPVIVPRLVDNFVDPLSNIGTIFIDECDMIATQKMSSALAFFTPRYIVGLSATPKRNDGLDGVITNYIGINKIIRLNPKPLVAIRILTEFIPPKNIKNNNFDWKNFEQELALNENRNDLISSVVSYIYSVFRLSILVVCIRQEQRDILTEKIEKINGKNSVSAFKAKISNPPCAPIIVGTNKKCGRGFDCKAAVLIWAYSTKSLTDIEQVCGRIGRRNDLNRRFIVDFVDININGQPDSILRKHWNVRSKWYRNEPEGKIFYANSKNYEKKLKDAYQLCCV